MSKATCFVVTYSVAILALFGIFCFLMSIVNPPPLKIEDKNSSDALNNNLADFYLRSMDPSDEVEYGLERAEVSQEKNESAPLFRHNLTNLLASVKYKNPNLRKVYPPLWPPTTSVTAQFIKPTKVHAKNETKTETTKLNDGANMTEITRLSDSPIKGHRRSVNNIESKTIDGSVILKILDDSGQSRIEIKLSPNEIFEKKRSRMHRSSVKKDSQFSMLINGQNTDVIDELYDDTENTEIRILPNDTIIIDKVLFDNKSEALTNITNAIERTKLFANVERINRTETTKDVSSRGAVGPVSTVGLRLKNTTRTPSNNNVTFDTNTIQPKSTFTEMFRLKLRFNNATQTFTKAYAIHDAHNKTH